MFCINRPDLSNKDGFGLKTVYIKECVQLFSTRALPNNPPKRRGYCWQCFLADEEEGREGEGEGEANEEEDVVVFFSRSIVEIVSAKQKREKVEVNGFDMGAGLVNTHPLSKKEKKKREKKNTVKLIVQTGTIVGYHPGALHSAGGTGKLYAKKRGGGGRKVLKESKPCLV